MLSRVGGTLLMIRGLLELRIVCYSMSGDGVVSTDLQPNREQ